MPDVTEVFPRTADGRFGAGNPGGPGRPRKVVNAAADALDARAAGVAGDLFDVMVELARERNVVALKMVFDRVWPANRSRPLEIGAPEIKHPRDLLTAMEGITNATLAGDATAREGADVAKVLKAHYQAIYDVDLEARLAELEEMRKQREAQE